MYEDGNDDYELIMQQRIQRLKKNEKYKNLSYQELKTLAEKEMMLEESAGKKTRSLFE
jgi:hypothetical protein